MVMFAMLFVSFMLDRRDHLALYESSRHALEISVGGINTLVLLCSSWFAALAVDAVRTDRPRRIGPCLTGAFLCGLLFVLIKIWVYAVKIQAGITPQTNGFFMYYFILTGIHFMHVVAGMVVLGVLWRNARRGAYSAKQCTGLEIGVSYWHMVDLLWIMLFALLYLTR